MLNLYIYLIIYIVFLLGVSYIISKKQSHEDYLIGSRNRGGWQIFLSKFAAAIGAAYFITYTGFAYEYGLGVFTMLLGLIIGYLLFAYWASPKIHAHSKENRMYTIGDFVYYRTKNNTAKKVANWFSNIILLAWLLIGMIGGAKIIQEFGFLSYEIAVLITSFVILSYILLAGFRAVLMTDVIQSFVIFVLLILVTFGIIGGINIGSLFDVETGKVGFDIIFAFFMFGLISIFSMSNMYQLCYAAKNSRKLKHGIGLSVIPILFMAFLLLLIGLFMAQNSPGLDSGLIFTEALKNFLPVSLLPLAIVLFFAGIMSSEDTDIYAISSHYAIGKKGNPVKNIRISTVVLIIIALVFSLLFRDIVDVSLLAGGLAMVLSFPMIYLIAGGNKPRKFFASIICGLTALIIGFIIFGIEPIVAIPVLIFSALGLLWKSEKHKNI